MEMPNFNILKIKVIFSLTVLLCLLVQVSVSAQSPEDEREIATKLVVMLKIQFDKKELSQNGAGIIFGEDKEHHYIVTANHLVRNGDELAKSVTVFLRESPDIALQTEVLGNLSDSLDLAVLRVKKVDGHANGKTLCIPFDRLSDARALNRGLHIFPVGWLTDFPWAMPVFPDAVAQTREKKFLFQSNFLGKGHAGGPLLTEMGEVLGMVSRGKLPLGFAIPISAILDQLRKWGYPIMLREGKFGRKSPLLKAIIEKDVEEASLLIQNCYDVNEQDEEDEVTPLILAAEGNSPELVNELLNAGAKVNITVGHSCTTPLHSAIHANHSDIKIIQLLLKNGADPTFGEGGSCMPPLESVARKGKENVLKALLETRSWKYTHEQEILNESFLTAATSKGQVKILKLLLEAGAEINAVNPRGRTALHESAEYARDEETVRFLLNAGASVDESHSLSGKRTALHLISNPGYSGDYTKIASLLIEAGADINALDEKEYTPLHHVFYGGSKEMAGLFFEICANPYTKNDAGKFPMELANEKRLREFFIFLRDSESFKKNQQCPENVRLKAN